MSKHILVNRNTAQALKVDDDDNCTEVAREMATTWTCKGDAESARYFMESEKMIAGGRYQAEPLTGTPQ